MQNLTAIKDQLSKLTFLDQINASTQTLINTKYEKLVKGELDEIFSKEQDESQLHDKLEQFLIKNWSRVKQTSVSYTALPNASITHSAII